MAQDLIDNFGLTRDKLVVLANPIPIERIREQLDWPSGLRRNDLKLNDRRPHQAFNLLAVGRLSQEKGFDLLIEAIAMLVKERPGITATIVGTGPEAANLYRLRRELALEAEVLFPGHLPDLSDQWRQASMFVLSSRHEGMPNALLEAAAAGLPIAATPCCQGVIDLLADAPYTWLAASITALDLSRAIRAALDAIPFAAPNRIKHAFLAPFELNTAIRAYDSLLNEVVMTGARAHRYPGSTGR